MRDGFVRLGRHEDAVRVLRAALRRGFINYPNLSRRPAALEDLRATDAFLALLAEIEPRWIEVVEWERGLGASEDGTLRGRFSTPRDFQVLDFTSSEILGYTLNELDLPTIQIRDLGTG